MVTDILNCNFFDILTNTEVIATNKNKSIVSWIKGMKDISFFLMLLKTYRETYIYTKDTFHSTNVM